MARVAEYRCLQATEFLLTPGQNLNHGKSYVCEGAVPPALGCVQ